MTDQAPERRGTLEEGIARAAELLDKDPLLAAEQARELLIALPNHPPALFLLASALRRAGKPQEAIELVEPLLDAQHGAEVRQVGDVVGGELLQLA